MKDGESGKGNVDRRHRETKRKEQKKEGRKQEKAKLVRFHLLE